jgi:hypothetical protein
MLKKLEVGKVYQWKPYDKSPIYLELILKFDILHYPSEATVYKIRYFSFNEKCCYAATLPTLHGYEEF